MIELPFFSGLWIGFFIVALSSFGVFFAHSLKTIVLFSAITLSGICFTIFNTDLLRSSEFGQFIILALCFLFLFQSLFFGFFIKSEIKKNAYFLSFTIFSFCDNGDFFGFNHFVAGFNFICTLFCRNSFL